MRWLWDRRNSESSEALIKLEERIVYLEEGLRLTGAIFSQEKKTLTKDTQAFENLINLIEEMANIIKTQNEALGSVYETLDGLIDLAAKDVKAREKLVKSSEETRKWIDTLANSGSKLLEAVKSFN